MEEPHRSLSEVAGLMGVSERTVRRWIKSGKLRAYKPGRDYRIPESAVRQLIEESEVSPKALAPPSLFNGLEEERRASWEAAAEEARRLRESGWAQMWRILSDWRASKKRGEAYAVRRKYLDAMGGLLQEVFDADLTLGKAYLDAALTLPGASESEVANRLREKSRATSHFYGELAGLVMSAGLSIDRGTDEGAAKEAPAEKRPHRIEENPAA